MNPKQIWQATLGELQLQTSKPNYETWLRNTWVISQQSDLFTIGVPSTFAKEWLETRFLGQIEKTLGGLAGQRLRVSMVVGQPGGSPSLAAESVTSPEPDPFAYDPIAPDTELAPVAVAARPQRQYAPSEGDWAPDSRYTFETFIKGPNNDLALAAALGGGQGSGKAYNPLFIYGGVGLGKTHLLHAIGHTVQAAGCRAVYVSSERFLTDLINAIQRGRTDDFRSYYRLADVLLIDDIQFIAGKDSTQTEFFHTFNELHGGGRQIVLSSDRPPRAMATLEERLRSRFEWGLVADVQPPDLETRQAILREKCRVRRAAVPDVVVQYIAQRVQSNIRELEGSLNRVLAYAELRQQPITTTLATDALADLLANSLRKRVTTEELLRAVCRFYRTDLSKLRGKQRDKEIVLPRQVAMYLLHKDLEVPLTEIGRELGGRDHSTVLHGVEKLARDIEANAQLRQDVGTLREGLYNGGKS